MLVFKLTCEHFARNAPKALVSLQHRDLSRIQKLYFASLGILNFQIPLYLTVDSILTKNTLTKFMHSSTVKSILHHIAPR